MLNISYDKEGDVLEIKFSDEKIEESEFLEESGLVLDYDSKENIVAIEIVSFSKRVSKNEALEAIALWFCIYRRPVWEYLTAYWRLRFALNSSPICHELWGMSNLASGFLPLTSDFLFLLTTYTYSVPVNMVNALPCHVPSGDWTRF